MTEVIATAACKQLQFETSIALAEASESCGSLPSAAPQNAVNDGVVVANLLLHQTAHRLTLN